MMLIGDKSKFAIELEESESILRSVLVWVDGIPIGTEEDKQSLGIVKYQLDRVIEDKDNLSFDVNDTDNSLSIFEKLSDEYSGKHILSLGDAFDDFSIRVFFKNEKFYFIWKLHEAPFFSYDQMNHSVNIAHVEYVVLKEVQSKLKDYINQTID